MTTGARIKAARKAARMTQSELAKRLGIPYQSIGQWENDLRNPKLETLQKIADALEVPLYTLIDSGFGALDSVLPPNLQGANLDGAKVDRNFLNSMLSKLYFLDRNSDEYKHAKENIFALAQSSGLLMYVESLMKEESHNIPDDAVSDVETDDLAIFDRVCLLTGHYARLKRDDLSGYYLGKHGDEDTEVFLSNKEFRALVKRIAAATAAMIDSEIEVAKDEQSPK